MTSTDSSLEIIKQALIQRARGYRRAAELRLDARDFAGCSSFEIRRKEVTDILSVHFGEVQTPTKP